MRLPNLSLAVLAAIASLATAPPSAAFAQAGFGPGGSGGTAAGATVETATKATTRLYVKTLPPGAQVTLDGKPLGASDGLFLVPAGTGKVSVQFDGAEPQVQQVDFVEGRITRVEVSLAGYQPAGAGGAAAAVAAREQAVPRRVAPRLTSKREPVEPKPLTAIDDVLEKPLEQPMEFNATTLRDVIAGFRQVAGIDVLIDHRGLEDAGLDLDTPITARLPAGLPLATALGVALRGVELTWIVRDDLLEITTRERAEERLFVHVHDVADLADTGDGLQLLIDLIQSSVAPDTWDCVGGPGSIRPHSTSLVISTSLELQRQVAGSLGVLRRLKATPADARRPLGVGGYWSRVPPAVAARAALAKPVGVDFQETPLREVTAALSKEAGVPIAVDMRELENAGLDLDLPVTFAVAGKPLAVVLDRILEPLELVVDVQDEGLVVTTQEKSEATMTVAVYPVGHLGGGDRSVGSLAELVTSTLVTSTVEPFSWDTVGGPAAVRPVDGDVPCLVVRHSTAGHRAVHGLLESLPPSRQPGAFAPTLEAEPRSGGMGGGNPFCWVAREVYGVDDPRWLVFRAWLTADAPTWLHDLYGKHGEAFAAWIRDKPAVKRVLRVLMDRAIRKSCPLPKLGKPATSSRGLQVVAGQEYPPGVAHLDGTVLWEYGFPYEDDNRPS
jgi:hypothetical protein